MRKSFWRVLLAERNDEDYHVIRKIFEEISAYDIVLHRVMTHDEAHETLLRERYDVCFFDHYPNEGTQLVLLDRARKVREQSIPYILLAKTEDYNVDVAATKAGAVDYLLKGHINAPLLERSIRYAIERKQELQRTAVELEKRVAQRTAELAEVNEKLRIENIERQRAMRALKDVAVSLEKAVAEAEQAKKEADAANQAKSEFLSRMSHELRTPLNAILGFGQILDKQENDELRKESIQYILKGGNHLLDLINEILDISRVETGRLEISLEAIALSDIIPEACALVQPLAVERNIYLRHEIPASAGNYVLADRQRLKQVVMNLLSNAIKYNRIGGQVMVSCTAKADGNIHILVRDTGPGISASDIAKLFTPFERLDAAESSTEGSGLGLMLSQRLVTAMGGTLGVESIVGEGSTFFVELPQAKVPLEGLVTLSPETSDGEQNTPSRREYSILCIEDSISNLDLIEAILESRPEINLLSAMRGSDGLNMARQHEPDLILLDLNLSDISGLEILARLRQSAITRDIPVIVISAHAEPEQAALLLESGAVAYLTKPLDVNDFLNTIDNVISKST